MSDPYDVLYRAIGRAVYEWAWLENEVSAFVFDLCAIHSRAFYEDKGVGVVASAYHVNAELKANIAVAKALAHELSEIPDFFARVESTLNPINNELRNERNRYVHDRWHVAGDEAFRYKSGSVIRREAATAQTILEHATRKHFESIGEVEAFADRLVEQRRMLMELSQEARDIYLLRYPERE